MLPQPPPALPPLLPSKQRGRCCRRNSRDAADELLHAVGVQRRWVTINSFMRSSFSYPFFSNAIFERDSSRMSFALPRGAFAITRETSSAFISGKNLSLKTSGGRTDESGVSFSAELLVCP